MRKLLIKVAAFLVICTIPIGIILSMADGASDSHYAQFNSPQQASLILGSSRARFAVQPSILDSMLQKEFPGLSVFNYAFTKNSAPYGPYYYESIKRKLKPDSKNGLFIVTVEPWLLAVYPDSVEFHEKETMVGKTYFVNMSPNYEYLLESFELRYWQILVGKTGSSKWMVHDNGWFEFLGSMHADSIKSRTRGKIKNYTIEPRGDLSPMRVEYLKKTIELLRQHGSVYLARMPVCYEIRKDEFMRFPEFDKTIADISKQFQIPYFDLNPLADSVVYIDGDHLPPAGGVVVTVTLARRIQEHHGN